MNKNKGHTHVIKHNGDCKSEGCGHKLGINNKSGLCFNCRTKATIKKARNDYFEWLEKEKPDKFKWFQENCGERPLDKKL